METTLNSHEGRTFISSSRGLHFVQINRYVELLSLLIYILVINIVEHHEVDRADSVYFAVALLLVFYLARSRTAREVFRSTVTIVRDGLEVEDEDDVARIPWPDVLCVRIDRSASGHRRKVFFRARGGRLFTLLDPEQGEQLEKWAIEVAQPAGVRVKIRERFYLNQEPVWTFLSCGIVLVVFEAIRMLGLF